MNGRRLGVYLVRKCGHCVLGVEYEIIGIVLIIDVEYNVENREAEVVRLRLEKDSLQDVKCLDVAYAGP